MWVELRDQNGKLWGEFDPIRNLLRFRVRRDGPAILFDLSDIARDAASDSTASGGIYLPEKQ